LTPPVSLRSPGGELRSPGAREHWSKTKEFQRRSLLARRALASVTGVEICKFKRVKLAESAPAWWTMPAAAAKAASDFERRHASLLAHAEHKLQLLESRGRRDDMVDERHFAKSVVDLERNRYFVPERASVLEGIAAQHQAKVWRLEESIWAPRAKWCDAKDFYDHEEFRRRRLDLDWLRLLERQNMAKEIVRMDDTNAIDLDGDGVADEVGEVREALWQFHEMHSAIFAHYASSAVGSDIQTMSFNAWNAFVGDFGLASAKSKHCKSADLDRIFITVDTRSRFAAGHKSEASTKGIFARKELDRTEFLAALIHVAIAKYILQGSLADVSDALVKLFAVDMSPRLDPLLFAEPNAFRAAHCYIESVDAPLRRHEAVLRHIFSGIPKIGLDASARAALSKSAKFPSLGPLVTLENWMNFLRALRVFDVDVAEREGQLCFCSARMGVVDGEAGKGLVKATSLPFEGFLEALCRLSTLKALPFKVDILAASAEDAGTFMLNLKATDLAAYNQLLQSRGSSWPGTPTGQPIGKCVEHLVLLIIRSIEADSALARVLLPPRGRLSLSPKK
jgi:hypothetical protein